MLAAGQPRQGVVDVGKKVFAPQRLDIVIRDYVLRTLEHFSGQKDIAARELGITVEELDKIAGA